MKTEVTIDVVLQNSRIFEDKLLPELRQEFQDLMQMAYALGKRDAINRMSHED